MVLSSKQSSQEQHIESDFVEEQSFKNEAPIPSDSIPTDLPVIKKKIKCIPEYLPGDVFIEIRNKDRLLHTLIYFFQKASIDNRDPNLVHAAIFAGENPKNKVPMVYEVISGGLRHQEKEEGYSWLCYRWHTDFDEGYFNVLAKKQWEQLSKAIDVLLDAVSHPFEPLTDVEIIRLKQILENDEEGLPEFFDKKLLMTEEPQLQNFIHACVIFKLRARVVELAAAQSKIKYSHGGAVLSAVGRKYRQSGITAQQMGELISGINKAGYDKIVKCFCSEFVVYLWNVATLELLKAKGLENEAEHYLPFRLNLNAASPAEMGTWFQEDKRWARVVTREEKFLREQLKERVAQAIASSSDRLAYQEKLAAIEQSETLYELLNSLTPLLYAARSKVSKENRFPLQESLWRALAQRNIQITPKEHKLRVLLNLESELLPGKIEKFMTQLFGELALTYAGNYEEKLEDARKAREAKHDALQDALEKGYRHPLLQFVEWVEKVHANYAEQPGLSAFKCILDAAIQDIEACQRENVSSIEELSAAERTQLVLIEEGILLSLYTQWCEFIRQVHPASVSAELQKLSQSVVLNFLGKRQSLYSQVNDNGSSSSNSQAQVEERAGAVWQVLNDYPDIHGRSLYHTQRLKTWQAALRNVLTLEETRFKVEMEFNGKIITGHLSDDLGNVLFDKEGTPLTDDQYPQDKHAIKKIEGFFFKTNREKDIDIFLKELAVQQIHHALGGDALALGSLWRITVEVPGKEPCTYPTWVSEALDGCLLTNIKQYNPNKLTQFALKDFTELFFLAILTNQADGQDGNFIFQGDYPKARIKGFDTGQAFVQPTKARWLKQGQLTPLIKSFMFLLPQMEAALDFFVVEKLCFIDIEMWLYEQSRIIRNRTALWKDLFKNQEARLAVGVPEASWLWVKLILKQVQRLLFKTPLVSHDNIFSSTMPDLATYYHTFRKKNIPTIEYFKQFSFTQIDPKVYRICKIHADEGFIDSLISILSPKEVRKAQLKGEHVIKIGGLTEEDFAHVDFSQMRDANGHPDIKWQQFYVDVMKNVPFKHLRLADCAVLTDSDIRDFLKISPALELLELQGCSNAVTGWRWLNASLFRTHPNLRLEITDTRLETHRLWQNLQYNQYVLWTRPRKIFLDRFKQWEENNWENLESKLFDLPLIEPEGEFLAEKILNDKILKEYIFTPMSHQDILDKGFSWLKHPLLRYRLLWNIFEGLNRNVKNGSSYDYLFRIILLGDGCVGKTHILERYVNNSFTPNNITTIGVDFKIKMLHLGNNTTVKLLIWDTAGAERFRTITTCYYRGVHGAVMLFDVTDMKSFSNVRHWKRSFDAKGPNRPVILAATKCDMTHYDLFPDKKKQLDDFCEELGFIGWVTVSAKYDIGVHQTIDTLIRAILKNTLKQSLPDGELGQQCNLILEKAHQLKDWPYIAQKMQYTFDFNRFYPQDLASSQQLSLSSIKGFSFTRLNLRGCHELDDDSLTELVSASSQLVSLDISDCPQLLGKKWPGLLIDKKSFELLYIEDITSCAPAMQSLYEWFSCRNHKYLTYQRASKSLISMFEELNALNTELTHKFFANVVGYSCLCEAYASENRLEEAEAIRAKDQADSQHLGSSSQNDSNEMIEVNETKGQKNKNESSYNNYALISKFFRSPISSAPARAGSGSSKPNNFLSPQEIDDYCAHQQILGYKPIRGDGNCFFRAVLVAIGENEEKHDNLRNKVIEYIEQHRENFVDYFPENVEQFDAYIQRMSQKREWAEGAIIDATALYLNITIDVIQLKKQNQEIHTEGRFTAAIAPDAKGKILLLRINNNHYDVGACSESPMIFHITSIAPS